MVLHRLPETVCFVIFDIDNTLYKNDEYLRHQVDRLFERFAEERGISIAESRAMIERARDEVARSAKARTTSMGNAMAALGVSLETNAQWRTDLFHPEHYLSRDGRLLDTLEQLKCRFLLAAVTNNSREIGVRTLDVLGVGSCFAWVIGLDTVCESKPSIAVFRHALDLAEVDADVSISVGDRYDVDIAPALSLGMGGVLVESLEDVYGLPSVLAIHAKS